jgi:FkbM family methyltransferase
MDPALVFDIGMFDGLDTAYYLARGFRVVAVEANPSLVELANQRFHGEIGSGQLIVVNVAIGAAAGTVALHLSAQDLGASSTIEGWVSRRNPAGVVEVPSLPMSDLLRRFGVPYYLKCDIEGADRHCILALNRSARPTYVSFEMGDDALELLDHLARIGYAAFKIINQRSFRELARVKALTERIAERLRRTIGLSTSEIAWCRGDRFVRGHSSGPMGERTDGRWRNYQATRHRWWEFCEKHPPEDRFGWYDLHACCLEAAACPGRSPMLTVG